jgi:hypothetical protein
MESMKSKRRKKTDLMLLKLLDTQIEKYLYKKDKTETTIDFMNTGFIIPVSKIETITAKIIHLLAKIELERR